MSQLNQLLHKIYGDRSDQILTGLKDLLDQQSSPNKPDDWYRDICLYVTYPDSFCKNGKCNLDALTKKVKHIKDLGCNAIHVLPFFKSPMIDLGFDVSNYKKVRKDLGGNDSFESFLSKCKDHDITVFADIVLNHISFEHRWFQKAINGDKKYMDFFIWKEEHPKFIKTLQKNGKTWARYEINGKTHDIFLIFPDQVGEIPHWYEGDDGNWYYHTFYPHQIDVDWTNPQVFIEFAKILAYWSQKGVSFRLDAIPFIGKNVDKGTYTDDKRTQLIVQALHEVIQQVSPDTVFLAEVAFELEKIKTYFGNNDIVESEMCYNFPLNAKLWLGLLSKDSAPIWEEIELIDKDVPSWAHWVNFLRNHDALMVDRIKPKDAEFVLKKLKSRGLEFAGATNVSGRTYSFLNENPLRHIMAHFLLASLPGSPAIIYGDEVAKTNDHKYMEKMLQWKRDHLDDETIKKDTRDISRGHISEKLLAKDKTDAIYTQLAKILNKRKELSSKLNKSPIKINAPKHIFAAKYGDIKVYINLSKNREEISMKNTSLIFSCNKATLEDDLLVLPKYSGVWLKDSNG
jgi:maltose alpha-D-glucosyltransferase/alpha-amylase